LEELKNGTGLGFDNAFHRQLAGAIQDGDGDRFLSADNLS
jgi:hypothetical protein